MSGVLCCEYLADSGGLGHRAAPGQLIHALGLTPPPSPPLPFGRPLPLAKKTTLAPLATIWSWALAGSGARLVSDDTAARQAGTPSALASSEAGFPSLLLLAGYDDLGLTCIRADYPSCRSGFTGVGPVCWHSSCGSGCTDLGATCYCTGATRGKSCCRKWGVVSTLSLHLDPDIGLIDLSISDGSAVACC